MSGENVADDFEDNELGYSTRLCSRPRDLQHKHIVVLCVFAGFLPSPLKEHLSWSVNIFLEDT